MNFYFRLFQFSNVELLQNKDALILIRNNARTTNRNMLKPLRKFLGRVHHKFLIHIENNIGAKVSYPLRRSDFEPFVVWKQNEKEAILVKVYVKVLGQRFPKLVIV